MQWIENDDGRIINLEFVRFFHKIEGKVYAVFDKDYKVSAMPPNGGTAEEVWESLKTQLQPVNVGKSVYEERGIREV